MRMTIQLFLNNSETEVFTLFDAPCNPFKVGDEIHLDIEDIYPADYEGYRDQFRARLLEDNATLQETFHRKGVRLVREAKYARYKKSKPVHLTIEYHCEIIDSL